MTPSGVNTPWSRLRLVSSSALKPAALSSATTCTYKASAMPQRVSAEGGKSNERRDTGVVLSVAKTANNAARRMTDGLSEHLLGEGGRSRSVPRKVVLCKRFIEAKGQYVLKVLIEIGCGSSCIPSPSEIHRSLHTRTQRTRTHTRWARMSDGMDTRRECGVAP